MEVLIMSKKEGRTEYRFRGFDSPNGTIVPDVFFDELAPQLGEAELRVLIYIIRRTFGFKKNSDDISLKQLVEGITTKDGRVLDRGAGVGKPAAIRAVKSLEEKGVIVKRTNYSRERGDEPNTYTLRFSDTPGFSKETRGGIPKKQAGVSLENPQETDLQETEKQHGVVVGDALTKFGITATVADQLIRSYPEAYLLAKLDLVQWLVDSRSALVGKNPAGYLRRAIEEDYAAPPTYRSPEQRSAVERARETDRAAAYEQRREAEAEYAREKAVAQQQLRERYPPEEIPGTALTTTAAWEQALDRLHGQLSRLNYETWLANTALIGLADGAAQIVAPSRFQAEHLTTRLQPLVAQALSDVLGQPVDCRFIALPELLDAEAAPPGTGSATAVIDPQEEESRRSRPHDTADQALTTGP
jgi:hypothetical protein